ncbi:MAG: hypothetical protein L3J75_15235 [Methylococcaceae bacterium]|nr:hypothetical protein [Methylococcaceae bacterium]
MKRYSFSFFFALISLYTINIAATEAGDIDNDLQSIQVTNGQAVIFLDQEIQQSSGLKTVKLQQVDFQAEFIVYGKAISVSPLLAIREQYLTATANRAGTKARLTQAENNISRLRNLYKNEIVSTRKLQSQQAQWQSDKAAYKSSTYQSQIIINNSQMQWGEILTQWAISKHSEQLENLITGKSTLLQLTLPAKSTLPSKTSSIYINPTADRNTAFKASLISISPQVDAFSQGLQYFFLSQNPAIKAGMNFAAWIPRQKHYQKGVIIPESSLAWHLGQSFVFIKTDEEHFFHRNVTSPIKVSNGYFIAEQIADGEEIVVTGTQMLLSHEFRSQIPDEDDDD